MVGSWEEVRHGDSDASDADAQPDAVSGEADCATDAASDGEAADAQGASWRALSGA
jgi:hypothetical protein